MLKRIDRLQLAARQCDPDFTDTPYAKPLYKDPSRG